MALEVRYTFWYVALSAKLHCQMTDQGEFYEQREHTAVAFFYYLNWKAVPKNSAHGVRFLAYTVCYLFIA